MTNNKNNGSLVSTKLFFSAIIIIFALMVASYILTLVLPCSGIPFLNWILSPVLVLASEDSTTLIGVIIFLLIIGGVFYAIENAGIMLYLLNKISDRYGRRKYILMAVIMLFFMSLGSLVGSFEEVVPMVPIVVALAVKLGWDNLTGISMSMLAVSCGFAAGIFNPFTVGIVQEMAGLPMFSGAWFRIIGFVCIYTLLFFFTRAHAKKIDRGISIYENEKFEKQHKKEKGVRLFACIILIGILIVISSSFFVFLRDYTFIIIGIMFLIAGILSCLISGMNINEYSKCFVKGLISMLPAVVMILMASSINYTLEYAGVLDIIIKSAIGFASTLPDWSVILFIYFFVLIMNFFISSGSAKAIMLTPLIIPLADVFDIFTACCRCLCIWRRIFEYFLSYESCFTYFTWTC